ncbi:MAG: NAD-dependent epimerase/dehydratase family protein [Acetobacteraceae bacterium]|nr:NAD-dependent epimerase/dehydratase family protein [Acetobacteraceae bacterium]
MSGAVLVVGGAGYIGAYVGKALADSDYRPVVPEELSTGHRPFVRWGPLVEANVTNTHTTGATLASENIHAVIDLAACIEVNESVCDPLQFYANSFSAKVLFLAALRDEGIERIILFANAAVYRKLDSVPFSKTHRLRPGNPCGGGKLAYEHMLTDLDAAHVVALRALEQAAYEAGTSATQTPWPVPRLQEAAFAAAGTAMPYRFAARRLGDPARLVAGATSAQRVLGREPRHSGRPAIVGSALAWHSRQPARG